MCHFCSLEVKKEKADFSSRKVFGVQVCCGAQPGIAEAQGIPPVGSGCPWYPCKVGSADGRSVPLRVSHTDTRHGDRESSVATTGAVKAPQPRRRGGGAPAGHRRRLGTCALPHRHPLPPAAQDSRSPLRNAFSDSQTPSRVARRVCSHRRTAQNFTCVLSGRRSRQVVHNAP